MVDCEERNRISRELAVAIRDMHRLKRERNNAPKDPSRIDTFFILSRRLERIRAEYRRHVEQHGCLNATESPLVCTDTTAS